jgi:hypothetical protein
MAWHDVLPVFELGDLLLKSFFPKFLDALCRWLAAPDFDFGQLLAWYEGWASLFPANVRQAIRFKV